VSNLNGNVLTYSWNFGDGTIGTAASPSHMYAAPGVYSFTVSVNDGHGGMVTSSGSVTIVTPVVGEGPDTDGDGFSDSFELAAGTSPTDPTDTPTGHPAGTPATLLPVKLQIKLNFAKTSSDSITLTGTLSVPGGFNPVGQRVTFGIGGVAHGFTLNNKGQGSDAKNIFKLTFKSQRSGTPAQVAPYVMKLAKDSLAPSLANDGLVGTFNDLGTPKVLTVAVVFDKTLFALQKTVTYKAKKGIEGTAQ
jgi:PKD repeat protein